MKVCFERNGCLINDRASDLPDVCNRWLNYATQEAKHANTCAHKSCGTHRNKPPAVVMCIIPPKPPLSSTLINTIIQSNKLQSLRRQMEPTVKLPPLASPCSLSAAVEGGLQ